jgi:hypothetical protein
MQLHTSTGRRATIDLTSAGPTAALTILGDQPERELAAVLTRDEAIELATALVDFAVRARRAANGSRLRPTDIAAPS